MLYNIYFKVIINNGTILRDSKYSFIYRTHQKKKVKLKNDPWN